MPIDRHQPVADEVPWSETVTAYDESHFLVYLRLLHMKKVGLGDKAMCLEVLGIDPECEPERARKVLTSHLNRARWMTDQGGRELMRRS